MHAIEKALIEWGKKMLLRSRERDDMHAIIPMAMLFQSAICYDPANGMTCMQLSIGGMMQSNFAVTIPRTG